MNSKVDNGPAACSRPGPLSARGRFLLALGVALLLYGLLRADEKRADALLATANLATAEATAGLVSASGLEVERAGLLLSHPGGFKMYIYYLCTGWPLVMVLTIGLAGLPGSPRGRLVFAVAGTALILVCNEIRLVILFWTGVYRPDLFYLVHVWIWEPLMLLCVGGVWLLWMHRAS